jgi:SAM-dependent methyltransferase
MSDATLEREKAEIVKRFGPWTADNIDLGQGVWTIGADRNEVAEARVERTVELVRGFARRPLEGLRILDLACYEGGFPIAFARRGASVVALEAREQHAAKARFAARALGLDRLEIVEGDVRDVGRLVEGPFDVVLCLGILYHLDEPGPFELLASLGELCEHLIVVETQVSLKPKRRVEFDGRAYWGSDHPENPQYPAASIDNLQSFWLTRASLLNLLADCGFSAACEVLQPVIVELAPWQDHVTLLAARGEQAGTARWPERLRRVAAPSQGPRHWATERLLRLRGGGLPSMFKRPER